MDLENICRDMVHMCASEFRKEENLKEVLAEGGATLSDLVKVTTYVVGKEYTQAARELGIQYWDKSNPPTSTLIVCAGLANPDFLVEIDAIAII